MDTPTIVSEFMQLSIRHGKPSSLNEFAQNSPFTIEQISSHFPTLKSLEQGVFLHMFTYTLSLIAQDADQLHTDFQTQALAFYFTFFELLSANRDYVYPALTEGVFELSNLYKLNPLAQEIKAFFSSKSDLNFGPLPLLNSLPKTIFQEIMWLQFLSILKFWLDDTSENFEKTDMFIEKSMAAQNEIFNMLRWGKLLDWGKFVIQETRRK